MLCLCYAIFPSRVMWDAILLMWLSALALAKDEVKEKAVSARGL